MWYVAKMQPRQVHPVVWSFKTATAPSLTQVEALIGQPSESNGCITLPLPLQWCTRLLKSMPAKSPIPAAKPWVLYVLRCKDKTLYCGITNDLARRFEQHSNGKGARYTKGRGPLKLVKSWPAESMSAALKAERAFKRLSKEAKQKKLRSRSRSDAISLLLEPSRVH